MRSLRGLFSFVLLLGFLLLIGSFFMRRYVIDLLENRAVASASVVVSRPLALYPGLNTHTAHITQRLERLGYQKTQTLPEHPGQFRDGAAELQIFLRDTVLPSSVQQREQLVSLELAKDGQITGLTDLKFRRSLESAWLEPETISLLGSSSTRVSSPRALAAFPQDLVNAILSIEDERFYLHFGIDPVAVSRALVTNLKAGGVVQGGSTITQQLAKNLFLSPERSFIRKLNEAFSAILIETAFTKSQILEFYLNEVFLGQEGQVAIHGFGEAAKSFFGKQVEDLTLAESALLAGIIKAPTRFSPRRNPDLARERRDVVLQKMLELKFITGDQLARALKEPLEIAPAQRSRRIAPYFVDYVRKQLDLILSGRDLHETKLRIHTGLDLEYQACAQNAVEQGLKNLQQQYPRLRKKKQPVQALLLSVIPSSGEILAWVGGRSYGENQFDRISLAKRQPGSSFKPFVYLTALDQRLNQYRVARASMILEDRPIALEIPGSEEWIPKNYDEEYRGDVTIREALIRSLNIPTVNLAIKVGIPSIRRAAELAGIMSPLPEVPALALGAVEVTPLELTRAYGTIANGGIRVNLRPVISITEENSRRPLFQSPVGEERVFSEPAVYVLTDILEGVLQSGTGTVVRSLGFTAPAAGKTGTTNDARDSWFVGFTPRLLAASWVGFDDNSELGLTGAQAAAPIWTEYMKCATKMEPELDFVMPPGVVKVQIDRRSGLLATAECNPADVVTEVFVQGTEPVSSCTEHDTDYGAPSSEKTPAENIYGEKNAPSISPSDPRYRSRHRSFWDSIFGKD